VESGSATVIDTGFQSVDNVYATGNYSDLEYRFFDGAKKKNVYCPGGSVFRRPAKTVAAVDPKVDRRTVRGIASRSRSVPLRAAAQNC